jgi:hypothetical protein
MSNYVYILFHGFYVLVLVENCCNRSTDHLTSGRDGLSYEDIRHGERDEEAHIRKGKYIVIDDHIYKRSKVSCNYILGDYYIILKNMYLFYEEFHL